MKVLEKIVKKNNDIYNEKPVTIAFLGDSVTQGCFEVFRKLDGRIETIYDGANAASENLKKILRTICPSAQINIINSGLSGDSSENGLKRFDRDITPFNPDLVVVGYALNDCTRGQDGIEEYGKNLEAIFNKVKDLGAECIFLTPNLMNDKVSPHLPLDIRDLAKSFLEFTSLGDYVKKAIETANKNGVKVCDVYSKWVKMKEYGIDTTELLSNKLNHPIRELNWLTAFMLAQILLDD